MAKKPQVSEVGDYDDDDDDIVGAVVHTSDGEVRNNSDDNPAGSTYRVTSAELRAFVERYERLEIEKKDIADHQKEVMAEAKSRGYDTKILRKIIALRKMDPEVVNEEEAVLEMYKDALGM